METTQLQQRVAGFISEHGLELAPELRLLDLVSEVGELAKERLRLTNYGQQPFTPDPAWADELGDVVFALLALASSTGVDIEDATLAAIAKYEQRIGRRGTASSS